MPTHMRGQAYLKVRDGSHAAAEFQRILEHRGIARASPSYALARTKAVIGDLVAARVAFEGFLSLGKDDDPAIPILKQAKAEYGNLQRY